MVYSGDMPINCWSNSAISLDSPSTAKFINLPWVSALTIELAVIAPVALATADATVASVVTNASLEVSIFADIYAPPEHSKPSAIKI